MHGCPVSAMLAEECEPRQCQTKGNYYYIINNLKCKKREREGERDREREREGETERERAEKLLSLRQAVSFLVRRARAQVRCEDEMFKSEILRSLTRNMTPLRAQIEAFEFIPYRSCSCE
jgi:hypothetical protein